MELGTIVTDFAAGMEQADARSPVELNARSKEPYQPGLGPHTEPHTVALVVAEMVRAKPNQYSDHQFGVAYEDGSRQKCDLCLGTPPDWDWAVEIKMIRMLGDNGKPNDNLPTHILSPYPQHRSALTDCDKLQASQLSGKKAIVIYGYDYPDFPLEPMVDAFEILARKRVGLGSRYSAPVENLGHPVHQRGAVMGWELDPE